jgi:type IV secretory pathway VirB10-like protein
MATTTMPPQVQKQLATRTHGKAVALVILTFLLGGAGLAYYLFSQRSSSKGAQQASTTRAGQWLGDDGYSLPEKLPVATPPPARDLTAEELARLRLEMMAILRRLDDLEKRKTTSSQTAAKPVEKRPAPMLYMHKDLGDKLPASAPTVAEYVLAPGVYLPCVIQPLMNSDVPGHFTAKITQNIYDTRTQQRLLVPQSATVIGHDKGEVLLYGNQRLPTFALTLTIEDRAYELETMPVTDQLGTNGLTGEVDNHWWRLFGAVFIGGALRGGQQALQMSVAQAGGAGQVASGIASTANQVTESRLGRALDTRPTIKVFSGQQCNVLLTKALSLPSVWQGGPVLPPTTTATTQTIRRER